MTNENKTPDPSKPGGDQDPNEMGGPVFHPDIGERDEASDKAFDKKALVDTAILDEDDVPAVTPPDER